MERQNNQLSFLDQLTNDLGGKRTAEFFRKCDKSCTPVRCGR